MPTSNRKPKVAVSTETVLVVEDDVLVRIVICEYLRHCGYRVLEAETGMELEAVRRFRQPPLLEEGGDDPFQECLNLLRHAHDSPEQAHQCDHHADWKNGLRWTEENRLIQVAVLDCRGADASGYCGMFVDSDKRKRNVPDSRTR